jgi:hypothetical protein
MCELQLQQAVTVWYVFFAAAHAPPVPLLQLYPSATGLHAACKKQRTIAKAEHALIAQLLCTPQLMLC